MHKQPYFDMSSAFLRIRISLEVWITTVTSILRTFTRKGTGFALSMNMFDFNTDTFNPYSHPVEPSKRQKETKTIGKYHRNGTNKSGSSTPGPSTTTGKQTKRTLPDHFVRSLSDPGQWSCSHPVRPKNLKLHNSTLLLNQMNQDVVNDRYTRSVDTSFSSKFRNGSERVNKNSTSACPYIKDKISEHNFLMIPSPTVDIGPQFPGIPEHATVKQHQSRIRKATMVFTPPSNSGNKNMGVTLDVGNICTTVSPTYNNRGIDVIYNVSPTPTTPSAYSCLENEDKNLCPNSSSNGRADSYKLKPSHELHEAQKDSEDDVLKTRHTTIDKQRKKGPSSAPLIRLTPHSDSDSDDIDYDLLSTFSNMDSPPRNDTPSTAMSVVTDKGLVAAATSSIKEGNMLPILKQEIKLKIQHQRLQNGQEELTLSSDDVERSQSRQVG